MRPAPNSPAAPGDRAAERALATAAGSAAGCDGPNGCGCQTALSFGLQRASRPGPAANSSQAPVAARIGRHDRLDRRLNQGLETGRLVIGPQPVVAIDFMGRNVVNDQQIGDAIARERADRQSVRGRPSPAMP